MDAPALSTPAAAVDRALVERIIESGVVLPDDVRAAVLALDRTASIPALVEILESDALAEEGSPGEGYAPVHAVALLRELKATEAIEPMLRVLARHDPVDLLCNDLVLALQALGAPVLEPAIAAHARAATDKQRMSVEDVLSALGVRDERVLAILLKVLEREPGFGAGLLAIYGDPAALPSLLAAFDASNVEPQGVSLADDDVIELAAAIEELGGTLTPDQQQRVATARAALRAALEAPQRAGVSRGDEDEADDAGERENDDVADAEERARILDQFAASTYAAAAPSQGWISSMLEYAAEYLGTPFVDLDADALDEIVFEIFPRKVSCAPEVAEEAVQSLRAFWLFARDVLSHPHAEECLEVLGEGAAVRLERELADPSNFGLAKSFVMGAGGPGLSGRLEGTGRRPAGSRAEKQRKKQVRKQRKKSQRRNRR